MKSISQLKHVYIFTQQVDKLDRFNQSRVDQTSQGWAIRDRR